MTFLFNNRFYEYPRIHLQKNFPQQKCFYFHILIFCFVLELIPELTKYLVAAWTMTYNHQKLSLCGILADCKHSCCRGIIILVGRVILMS